MPHSLQKLSKLVSYCSKFLICGNTRRVKRFVQGRFECPTQVAFITMRPSLTTAKSLGTSYSCSSK